MLFIEFFNKRLKRIGLLDIKLAQTAALFVGVIVAKLIPQVQSVSIWWLAGLALLFWARPVWVVLRSE